MKKYLTLFTVLFSLHNFSYAVDIDHKKFISDYQENIKYIIKNYPQKEGKTLDAQIFDINNNSFLSFLNTSKGYKKPEGDILAMMYYEQFKVNNSETSFCFILYDSKSNLLKNYLKNTLLNYADTTTYLSLHEMGHCLYSHQLQIGEIKSAISPRENEQLADMFSIAYFSILGQNDNAVKIIRQSRRIDSKDIHSNGDKLEKFYIAFNDLDNIKQYNDFEKIFKITYSLFNQV